MPRNNIVHPIKQILGGKAASKTCSQVIKYRNLVIFRVENILYIIISCSFNFVCSPYHI